MIIFSFFGPPLVSTPKKIIKEALRKISPKKGDIFIDLGSGYGSVVKTAVKEYEVEGWGVEINPLLVWWSRFSAYLAGLKKIKFKKENFFKTDLSKADIVFVYLLPKYLSKMADKIKKECRPGTWIISQRFLINDLKKCLVKQIDRKHNSTYFYKI